MAVNPILSPMENCGMNSRDKIKNTKKEKPPYNISQMKEF